MKTSVMMRSPLGAEGRRKGEAVDLTGSELLDVPLRRDITLGSTQRLVVGIGTELHQHLATTINFVGTAQK